MVPPLRTGKTSLSTPTVVDDDGVPAVTQASVFGGAFGKKVSGSPQPPLVTAAYGSFDQPDPLGTPACARLLTS